jgi:hypothetical protein
MVWSDRPEICRLSLKCVVLSLWYIVVRTALLSVRAMYEKQAMIKANFLPLRLLPPVEMRWYRLLRLSIMIVLPDREVSRPVMLDSKSDSGSGTKISTARACLSERGPKT